MKYAWIKIITTVDFSDRWTNILMQCIHQCQTQNSVNYRTHCRIENSFEWTQQQIYSMSQKRKKAIEIVVYFMNRFLSQSFRQKRFRGSGFKFATARFGRTNKRNAIKMVMDSWCLFTLRCFDHRFL